MSLTGKHVGVALTGSFCTYEKVFRELQKLVDAGANVQTIFSDAAQTIDSRFGKAEDFMKKAEAITGNKPLLTISEAEPSAPAVCWTFSSSSPAPAIQLQNWPMESPIPLPDGCKSPSPEQQTAADFHFYERCLGHEYEKYRFAAQCQKHLFYSFWSG